MTKAWWEYDDGSKQEFGIDKITFPLSVTTLSVAKSPLADVDIQMVENKPFPDILKVSSSSLDDDFNFNEFAAPVSMAVLYPNQIYIPIDTIRWDANNDVYYIDNTVVSKTRYDNFQERFLKGFNGTAISLRMNTYAALVGLGPSVFDVIDFSDYDRNVIQFGQNVAKEALDSYLYDQSVKLPGMTELVDVSLVPCSYGGSVASLFKCVGWSLQNELTVAKVIFHLNDDHKAPRELVADWLDELADNHGYNFDF